MDIFIQCLLLILGFIMLIKGADWFVDGASGIAERFGIPEIVIGLTIVAFGTSAPEAAVSITAALQGNADISIGNIFGSNIMNILLILGITSIIAPLAVKKNTIKFEMPFLIIISILILTLGLIGNAIGLIDGIIMWLFFGAFFVYLIKSSINSKRQLSKDDAEFQEIKPKKKLWISIVLTLVGLVLVVFGSNVTVDSASSLAKTFGLSERLIGLTIVAFGTSLPELVTSIIAGKRGKTDIAIGNIVGSNIFNILFVIGTTSLISQIPFADSFIIDGIIAIAAAVLLLLCCLRKKALTRTGGIIMLICYAAYFIHLILG